MPPFEYLSVLGSATAWSYGLEGSVDGRGIPMKQKGDDPYIWIYEGTLIPGYFHIHLEERVDLEGKWLNACQWEQSLSESCFEIGAFNNDPDNHDDAPFVITEKGSYRVTVNFRSQEIIFEQIDYYPDLLLMGDATLAGWAVPNDDEIMLQDETYPSVYTWQGSLTSGELKISSKNPVSWHDGWDWIHPNSQEETIVPGSAGGLQIQQKGASDYNDWKWVLNASEEGDYLITVDLSEETILFENLSLKTGNYVQPQEESGSYTIGDLDIYPNPASDLLWVNSEEIEKGQIYIMDMNGQVVVSKQIISDSNLTHFDVSKIEPGFYIIKISSKGGVVQLAKIIIE